VEEGLWDNGQIMLIDIARREKLKYGPNRRMQELMASRNDQILAITRASTLSADLVDRRIAEINSKYIEQITRAAREFPDMPSTVDKDDSEDNNTTLVIVVICCSMAVISVVACAAYLVIQSKKKQWQTPTRAFQGENVVVGQPVPTNGDALPVSGILGGTPVTVAAPMKVSKTDQS